jgi:hypothetical protein
MSHKAEMILDQIDVVKLDINLWTSSKKLRPEDLVLADGSKLPPEDLAYLGTKKTIDPDKLKEFNRIKKEAERICLQSGTRFLGGFANPRDEIPRLTQELDDLSKTFYEARDQLLATYHEDTEEWIARHAEFGDAIRRAIEPVDSVAAKLRFDYVVFRVTVPQSDAVLPDSTPAAVDSLTRRTNSISCSTKSLRKPVNLSIDLSLVRILSPAVLSMLFGECGISWTALVFLIIGACLLSIESMLYWTPCPNKVPITVLLSTAFSRLVCCCQILTKSNVMAVVCC